MFEKMKQYYPDEVAYYLKDGRHIEQKGDIAEVTGKYQQKVMFVIPENCEVKWYYGNKALVCTFPADTWEVYETLRKAAMELLEREQHMAARMETWRKGFFPTIP